MTADLIIKLIGDVLIAAVLFYVITRFESGDYQSGKVVNKNTEEMRAQQKALIEEMRTQNRELIEAMRKQDDMRTEVMMARIVAAIEQRLDEHNETTSEAHREILARMEKRR